jgi:hypothetical protein
MELTATYSGSETVSFQWKKNGGNLGTASAVNTYTPDEAGNYTVTVGAAGYNSKTSAAVTVQVDPMICKCPNGTIHETGEECCEFDDCKCTYNKSLYLDAEKTLEIMLVYNKDEDNDIPQHLNKIVGLVDEFAGNTGGVVRDIRERLSMRDRNYKIIVKYDDMFEGFELKDGQTLEVHNSWLLSEDTNIPFGMFRNFLSNMADITMPTRGSAQVSDTTLG